MVSVLIVCLGNICRSPMAEGILRHKTEELGLNVFIDSAGTSNYHIGEHPDERAITNAKKHGIDISKLKARQFKAKDFDAFDHLFVMDESNYRDVISLARTKNDIEKVELILKRSPSQNNNSVPDPYFGGEDEFEHVFELLDKACESIANSLKQTY